jgi:hypothetical protein
MPNELLSCLHRLSDLELVARLKSLAARERAATAELVAHLAEMETRDIHLREGYSSLFVYCRDVLGLSEHEAYNRIEAARAARRFPVILERLTAGALNLTTVRLLAPHLTAENHLKVLRAAEGKRKAEVEEIVAGLAPRPEVEVSVRRLPTVASRLPAVASRLPAIPAEAAKSVPSVSPSVPSVSPSARSGRPTVTPLAPQRYRLQCTIDGENLEKLRLAQDLLRHTIPTGDEAAILGRALDALLADLARLKFAATEKPRPSRGTAPGSRHIPSEVKRAVWLRDLGRCGFIGRGGHRCEERAFVEFHHREPYAVGGPATVANVELRCRRHNLHEARTFFGASRTYLPGGLGEGDAPRGGRLVPERVGT